MWYFRSPLIAFGEGALAQLEQVTGNRAFIVTDAMMQTLGFVKQIQDVLVEAGIESAVFAEVEPDPGVQTAKRCARAMQEFAPDLVIGLGGGSSLDAAKAAWFLYERPDIELEAVAPFEQFGLRSKARFITIPTTAGSGAEVTGGAVIKDEDGMRKMEVATYELVADWTIVDPAFSSAMPPRLTADTGIDVLTHAVEGMTSTFANDYSDALCLHATRMVFDYLPRAYANGKDAEAREKMANAATISALGMGSSHIALAHGFGHSAGTVFEIPHGRITGLFLPYTIEYTSNGGAGRYKELARALGLPSDDEEHAAANLANAIRDLLRRIDQPITLRELGLTRQVLDENLATLCDRVEMDSSLATSLRFPYREDIERIFLYAYEGRKVDF